jgi:hypothetical protein
MRKVCGPHVETKYAQEHSESGWLTKAAANISQIVFGIDDEQDNCGSHTLFRNEARCIRNETKDIANHAEHRYAQLKHKPLLF